MRLPVSLLALLVVAACSREPARIGVGAAAVMRHAMPELVAAYARATGGVELDVVYGSSDAVASHVTLDVLVLADAQGFPAGSTPQAIATTQLVLVGPAGAAHRFDALADTVVAIGDPQMVPVGRYARQLLEQLGVWPQVSSRAVLGGDVAAVLALARRGTAHAAIVYATDAVDADPLVVLDRAATRIDIRAAALPGSRNARHAAAFVAFLRSPDARAILARHGFGP